MAPKVRAMAAAIVIGPAAAPMPVASRADMGAGRPRTAIEVMETLRYRTEITSRVTVVALLMSPISADRWVAASQPTKANKSTPAAETTPARPYGAKGVKFAALACGAAVMTA